jgi:hypothetical protein
MTVSFFVGLIPPRTTHQSKKIGINRATGHGALRDSKALVATKAFLDGAILPHRPKAPLEGALELRITYTWPHPSDTPVAIKRGPTRRKTTKPDCSNFAKTIEDRLVHWKFMHDDNQVSDLVVRKRWGQRPGIYVVLSEVPPHIEES